MKAAVLTTPGSVVDRPLRIVEVPKAEAGAGQVLLRVLACGVCRTDLHIVEGELAPLRQNLIPGHQIVGEVVGGATGRNQELPLGARVGVSWIGGTDGECWYCRHNLENLCDAPTFTGYSVNGGYAEFAAARADFVFPLPASLDALHAAPLLCAGIIGFRSLRVAGVEPGERVGLFGFGASAHLAIEVLKHWGCEVYVSTRGDSHRKLAESLGAKWVGSEVDRPPWSWTVPLPLPRAATWWWRRLPACEKAAWLRSTRSILTAFLSSTMTGCCGASGRSAASPT